MPYGPLCLSVSLAPVCCAHLHSPCPLVMMFAVTPASCSDPLTDCSTWSRDLTLTPHVT